jgi:hypothetical protein
MKAPAAPSDAISANQTTKTTITLRRIPLSGADGVMVGRKKAVVSISLSSNLRFASDATTYHYHLHCASHLSSSHGALDK